MPMDENEPDSITAFLSAVLFFF